MNFVLDCSLAMAWVLADEATPETDAVLDKLGHGSIAIAPALWRWEVSNVLLNLRRRKRATENEIKRYLIFFQSLPIEIDEPAHDHAFGATHSLAEKHGLASYDAAYLELAIRRNLPLATLDNILTRAARAEGAILATDSSGH